MKTCSGCGANMQKAHAYHGDAPYCTRCYYREFEVVACSGCGCRMRTWRGEEPHLCRSCRVKDRLCMRCGKPTPRSHYRSPTGEVACKACRQMVAPPKECSYCGKLAQRVVRDRKAGFTEPACEQCRRAQFVTCASCRKYREAAGTDSDGRNICAACVVEPKFICPVCQQPGIRQSSRWCRKCYEIDYARKRCALAVECLEVPYVRTIFLAFFEQLLQTIERPINLRKQMKVHIEFFQRVEKIAPTPMRLTASALLSEFGRHGIRMHLRAYNYLVDAGHIEILSTEESDDIAEAAIRRRLLDSVSVDWHRNALERFEAAQVHKRRTFQKRGWTGEQERFLARTITLHVRAAKQLLVSLPSDIPSLEAVSQEHLDHFLMKKPGHRNALHAFINYLDEKGKTFAKLRIERPGPKQAPMHLVLSPSASAAFVAKWLNPATEHQLKKSLILLFMLLYGQNATQVTNFEWSQFVRGPDSVWRARFAKVWIPLDLRFGTLFDRYAAGHRPEEDSTDPRNRYVFPGRKAGSSLSPASVTEYLIEEGIRAQQLFSTCIVNAYRNGVQFPKTLVNALGISDMTAIAYFNQLDSRAAKTYAKKHGLG